MIDLAQHEELWVFQQVEHLEAFIGFETANQYSVFTPDGYEMLHAFEESGTVSRQFMGSHRPLNIHVVDNQGDAVMTASRPFFWFRSNLQVMDGYGNHMGALYRQFGILGRKFALMDANDRQIAQIKGNVFRRYTFVVEDSGGSELGRITKEWGGLLREAYTDLDTFRIRFRDRERSHEFRTLVLASAFAIDMDFFEGKAGPG